jgi:hypothetical protein
VPDDGINFEKYCPSSGVAYILRFKASATVNKKWGAFVRLFSWGRPRATVILKDRRFCAYFTAKMAFSDWLKQRNLFDHKKSGHITVNFRVPGQHLI